MRGRPDFPLWTAAAIVLAIAAAYWGSMRGPLVFDDVPGILENPTLRHPGELGRLLFPPADQAGTVGGRPLLNLSLALNFALGGTRVWGYHALNLAIHAGAALLLFGIVRRTPWHGRRAIDGTVFAGAVALLWALHPLQTQAVTYLIQRAESLMGLFYFLTLYSFIRGWKVAAVIACLAGMATKEPMVSAPVLVLLYDRTFVAGSFRAAWLRGKGFYLALASTWILLAVLVATSHGRGGSAGFGSAAAVWPYALTQCWALARYLHLAFWPRPLIFDYGIKLWQSPAEILPQIGLLLLLLAGTGWALVRRPALGFLGVWFFAILAPSSSFIPIATEPIAEQRMYLPLAAVVVLAMVAIDAWLARRVPPEGNRRRLPWLFGGLGILAVLLAALTAQRNRDYRSDVALWADTAAKAPDNPRAHNDLGTALRAAGQDSAAAAEFAAALRVQPDYAPAHFNLGVLLLDSGRPTEAVPHLERALTAPLHQAELQLYLAQALVAAGRLEEAAIHGQEAVRLAPHDSAAASAWGCALAGLGRYRQAATAFERAVAAAPASARLRNNWANALLLSGQVPEAVAQYREALRLGPGDAAIRANLEAALQAQRR